jgi:hypothetical protein
MRENRPTEPGERLTEGDAETMDVRGSGSGVLAAAAVFTVVAAAVAGAGLGVGGDQDARRPAAAPSWDVAAPPPLGPTSRSRSAAAAVQEVRQVVVVRPSEAALGRAALVVRATQRPAPVRLVVRGTAGHGVVRSVVVRSGGGRRLVLDGLDPGTYRWLVTSPTATPVSGRMRVAGESPLPATAAVVVQK